MLNREEILKAKDLKTAVVAIPEWNGEVTVRELTANRAMALSQRVKEDDKQSMILWVTASVIGEDGNTLFNDTDEDRAILGQMSAAAIIRIGKKAIELSGLGDAEVEAIKN